MPFCIVANAGTTNTGAVDPLTDLAQICDRQGLWLHVDAAFGGAAVLAPEGKRLLEGIGRAHSVTIDPHKWWFQPYECSVLMVRDPEALRRAFRTQAAYLDPIPRVLNEPNLLEYGPQMTRTFNAAKLWFSLQVFGADAFAAAVSHGIELAEMAETLVRVAGWDITSRAQLGIVTFRVPGGDAAQEAAAKSARSRSNAFVGTTRLRDQTVIRLCCINPATTSADLAATIGGLSDAN